MSPKCYHKALLYEAEKQNQRRGRQGETAESEEVRESVFVTF